MPGGVEVPPRLRADSPSAQTECFVDPGAQTSPADRPGRNRRQNRAARAAERVGLARRHARGTTRLWEDDALGAVGRTPRSASGVGVVREGRRRPRRAVDRRRRCDRRCRAAPPAATQLLAAHGGGIGIVPAFVAAIEPIGRADDHRARSRRTRDAAANPSPRSPSSRCGCLADGDWRWHRASPCRSRPRGFAPRVASPNWARPSWRCPLTRLKRCSPARMSHAPATHDRRTARPHRRLAGRAVSRRARDAGGHADRRIRRSEATIAGSASICAPSCCRTSLPTRRAFCCAPRCSTACRGPLCDAVTGVSGSAATLEDLVGRNMLVVPLDRHREWYRYHHLLREHLQAELRMQSPDEIAAAALASGGSGT